MNASRVHSSGLCECTTAKLKPLPDQLADAYEFHSIQNTLPAPPSFFYSPSQDKSHTDVPVTTTTVQNLVYAPVEHERLLRLGLLLGRFLAEAGWRPSALSVLRSTSSLAIRLIPPQCFSLSTTCSVVVDSPASAASCITELSACAARVAFEAAVEYVLLRFTVIQITVRAALLVREKHI